MTAREARALSNRLSEAEEIRKDIDMVIEREARCGYTECKCISIHNLWSDEVIADLEKDGFKVKFECVGPDFIYYISWELV